MLIGIVAHTARAQQARKLKDTIGAAFISTDNGTLGCEGNHQRTWRWLAAHCTGHDFAVLLEDDAVPCKGFRHQLDAALVTAPPSAGVISLYLGRQRPPQAQHAVQDAIQRAAAADACWIMSNHLIHAVGVVIRTELLQDWVNHPDPGLPSDEALDTWIATKTRVAYAHPSLVEHADTPTLVEHRDGQPRPPGRIAWNHGTRTDWNHTTVEMYL
jgi:hypothetical protein